MEEWLANHHNFFSKKKNPAIMVILTIKLQPPCIFQNGHLNTFQKLNKSIHKFPLPQISKGNGHKIVKKQLLLTVIDIYGYLKVNKNIFWLLLTAEGFNYQYYTNL